MLSWYIPLRCPHSPSLPQRGLQPLPERWQRPLQRLQVVHLCSVCAFARPSLRNPDDFGSVAQRGTRWDLARDVSVVPCQTRRAEHEETDKTLTRRRWFGSGEVGERALLLLVMRKVSVGADMSTSIAGSQNTKQQWHKCASIGLAPPWTPSTYVAAEHAVHHRGNAAGGWRTSDSRAGERSAPRRRIYGRLSEDRCCG